MSMSNAKQLAITGLPGVGKTTLMLKIVNYLKESCSNIKWCGFVTEEIRDPNNSKERIGFQILTYPRNSRYTLASCDNSAMTRNYPKVGKYNVHVDSVDQCVQELMQYVKRERVSDQMTIEWCKWEARNQSNGHGRAAECQKMGSIAERLRLIYS